MPAYRSEAEAEVRRAVVNKLRTVRPNARIIHEINTCGFGNRVDVMAVSPAEIIAVEIKSEKDKLTRLPDQISAMHGVAHHVVSAIHEKFLVEQETNQWAAHSERDGKYFMRTTPRETNGSIAWVYPEKRRALRTAKHDSHERWQELQLVPQTTLPNDAIHMLWRDELAELCGINGVAVPKRANMPLMVNSLWWSVAGGALTKGICAALRRRECIEADPPISD